LAFAVGVVAFARRNDRDQAPASSRYTGKSNGDPERRVSHLRRLSITLLLPSGDQKGQNFARVEYWEIIADNLSKAGLSWGCVSTVDSNGRTIFLPDTYRDDGKRFVVRADEHLTAFVELESTIRLAMDVCAGARVRSAAVF